MFIKIQRRTKGINILFKKNEFYVDIFVHLISVRIMGDTLSFLLKYCENLDLEIFLLDFYEATIDSKINAKKILLEDMIMCHS